MWEWVLWPEKLPKSCHRKLWAAPSGDAIHYIHHPGGCTEVYPICGNDWEGDSPPEGMEKEWQQNPEEKENEEQKEETVEPKPVEEEKTFAKDSQEETPSAFADVDVDDIKNSKDLQSVLPNEEELKKFTSGITIGNNLNANSSRIHEEYEKMSAELENSENPEVEEEKGRTL